MHSAYRVTRSLNLAAVLAVAWTISVAADAQAQANPWGAEAGKGSGRYADVNEIKLYCEISGSGRPLVLLHGGLGAIEMFGPNLPALASSRQVIAVDLQGHGRTAEINRPLSVKLMADDIAALIKHLRVERWEFMGYSLGGGIALQTAIRHPDVVSKLVVASTPLRRNAFYADVLAQQGQVNAAVADAMKQTPMYQLNSSIAPRPEDWPRLLGKIGEAMKKDFDFSQDIPNIKATTLIVAADADIFPPAHAVELFGLLGGGLRDGRWDGSGRPKSKLAIPPGLTHYNIFSDPALAATVTRSSTNRRRRADNRRDAAGNLGKRAVRLASLASRLVSLAHQVGLSGIGGNLAAPALPHHRTDGSRLQRFGGCSGWVSRRSGSAVRAQRSSALTA